MDAPVAPISGSSRTNRSSAVASAAPAVSGSMLKIVTSAAAVLSRSRSNAVTERRAVIAAPSASDPVIANTSQASSSVAHLRRHSAVAHREAAPLTSPHLLVVSRDPLSVLKQISQTGGGAQACVVGWCQPHPANAC